jgi:hypothetical protein
MKKITLHLEVPKDMSQTTVADLVSAQTQKVFVVDERKGPSVIGQLTKGDETDIAKVASLESIGIKLKKHTK